MNSTYWDNEGATKTFTHELFQEWIKDIPLDTNVLDFGCGYGRITKQLYELGFKNIVGYDPSSKMISRAIVENSGPQYTTEIEDISKLFSEWREIYSRNIAGKTLNGNIINLSQLLYKKTTCHSIGLAEARLRI